jgi:Fe-S cluster assembly protein SufD
MKMRNVPLSENLTDVLRAGGPLTTREAPAWLTEEQDVCRRMFLEQGLPGRGREPWKYTDVAIINTEEWTLAGSRHQEHSLSDTARSQHDAILTLTILNGSYLPVSQKDLPAGMEVHALSDPAHLHGIKPILQRTNYRLESPFTILNRALWHDGICIHAEPETKAALHIQLVYGDPGQKPLLSAPRVYIKAGAHSELEVTVSQWSRDQQPSFGTACLDLDIAAGARVTFAHEQKLNMAACQFTTTRVSVGRDATFHAMDLAVGAALARHDLSVYLQESGSETTLNGIYLLKNRQVTDFHTIIEHRQPHCRSRQVYKGVLDDHAHAIFNGLVEVHPGAMGTDGYQLNRTLMRSPHAVIDTKPELQIHNDDVRCSHGATIGQIDPLELFYLQSRSIPTELAKAMLSQAFVTDLIRQQPSHAQQKHLDHAVEAFFHTK